MALAYLERSEVDHAVNFWMGVEDFVKSRFIGDVNDVEVRSLFGDEFNAIDDFFVRIV